MTKHRLTRNMALVFAVPLLLLVMTASSQTAAPDKSRGVSRVELTSIDLGTELEGMPGRTLRQHKTTIEPGGVIAVHDHVDRPEIILVYAGRLTDHQGDDARDYVAGQSYAVGRKTTHWLENRGTEPAVFVATSLVKAQR